MYASNPFSNRSQPAPAGVYAQVGLESGVNAADPHMLIAMLFDGALEAIARARKALKEGSIEAKGQAIGKAVRIVDQGLRGGLNMNSNALASDLAALYAYLVTRLTHANIKNDDAALQECSQLVQPLRDAWAEIRGKVVSGAPPNLPLHVRPPEGARGNLGRPGVSSGATT